MTTTVKDWQDLNLVPERCAEVCRPFLQMLPRDNLANYFNRDSATNAYLVWMANLIFGLRIYFDFAGYSLNAYGIARYFGIRLTLNFLSPYCANSIIEFWRRWHVTLSNWFRD